MNLLVCSASENFNALKLLNGVNALTNHLITSASHTQDDIEDVLHWIQQSTRQINSNVIKWNCKESFSNMNNMGSAERILAYYSVWKTYVHYCSLHIHPHRSSFSSPVRNSQTRAWLTSVVSPCSEKRRQPWPHYHICLLFSKIHRLWNNILGDFFFFFYMNKSQKINTHWEKHGIFIWYNFLDFLFVLKQING